MRDLWLKEVHMHAQDVVSLLTNVLINKVMAVIRKQVEGDTTLKSRMNLTPNEVMSLLGFVMSMTYFHLMVSSTNRSMEHPWRFWYLWW